MRLATNIVYEPDDLDVSLPSEMRIPAFIPEEQVADYISDETGFLVVNYCLSE